VPIVTNSSCLLEFSKIQANQGWTFRLEGVVTWADSSRGWLVLQDAEGALALHMDFQSKEIKLGQRIRVESESAAFRIPAFPEFPLKPSRNEWLPTLASPTNQGSYYLARMHGFLIPPTTGEYNFWLASKGSSEFWLGTNADASGLRRIASVPTGRATNPGQWDKFPTQSSGLIHLDAGQPYLFDVMHEHRAGRDDTVAVAWQGPGISQSIVDGRFLVPCSNHDTNGVIREFWNDYFLAALQPLTAGESVNSEITVASARIQILGESTFPKPLPVQLGAAIAPPENFRWVEVEGTVGFAAKGSNDLTLELVQDRARAVLKFPAAAKINLAELVGAKVRVRGVCESVLDENGNRTAGVIWVPSEKELSEIAPDAGIFQPLKVVSIGELNPANPVLAAGRRIRVRGTVLHQADGKIIIQGAARFSGYVSTNGTEWKSLAPPVDVLMRDTDLGGLLASAYKSGKLITARFDSVSGLDETGLDAELSDAIPVGKTTAPGGGKFLLQGGGTGFGSIFERVHFYCEPLADKTEIIARLTNLESSEPEAVAGIMMRDSTDPRASFASVLLNVGGEVVFRFRQSQSERDEAVSLPGYTTPCWLKLTRSFPLLEIQPENLFPANRGEAVDITGLLQWNGSQPVLVNARRLNQATTVNVLSSTNPATSLLEISAAPVAAHLAQLVPERGEGLREGSGSIIARGVVTFSGQAFGTNYLVLQDETAGASVRLTARFAHRALFVGQRVELEIKSQNGKWPFPPDPNRVQVIGAAQLPDPMSLATANTQTRRGEFFRIESQGIVRAASAGEGLKLVTRTGEIPVWLGETSEAEMSRLVDALVRIRGVLIYRDSKTTLLAPSSACVEVLESAPSDPFAVPAIAIDSLKNFSRQAATSHRAKISGAVTYKNEQLLVIQDDTGGVQLKISVPPKISVGDSVEAVGFPDGQPGSLSLSQALVRKGGNNLMPSAVAVSGGELYSGAYGAKVVRLAGELLGQKSEDGNQILELQSGQRIVRAEFLNRHSNFKSIPVGSQVQVTGVSWPERIGNSPAENAGGDLAAASFSIFLRTPDDVTVVQLPPWWAWKHATAIIGTLAFVLVAAMLWIRYLRLKVARRTRQLNETMSKLERETEASATLAERNRLAGEIHDGLEQGLSAVMMQLDGLESKLPADPAGVARHLELARSMVRFSRTEVRHSLWDWKSSALADKDLGGAIGDIAKQMNNGNEARVTVQVSGKAVALPTAIEHHLLRIAQEALNNAFKYSAASAINISLDYSGEKVLLLVRDNGRGFDLEHVLNGSNGHFGLQNLRSRARKMGGTLKINSVIGSGTIIKATVPVVLTPLKSNSDGQDSLA
jgi:signal transduction histidine kinase